MTPDYAACLTVLYPDATWSLNANDLATLSWDGPGAAPSQATLDAAWPTVQHDLQTARVRAERHAAYSAPDGPDSIYFRWQRGDATEQEYLDAVQSVKDAHPYPTAP
jgi:hypothetical protein